MADIDPQVPENGADTGRKEEWDRLAQAENGQPATDPTPSNGSEQIPPEDSEQAGDKPPVGEESSAPDPWVDAPAPLREAFEQERVARATAEQHARTQAGRLTAEARRALALQAERDALAARLTDQEPKTEAPVIDDEALARLREDYPDVAAPLLDVIAGLERKLGTLSARDASREEQQAVATQLDTQRFLAEQEQLLLGDHPDWLETVRTPEFATWANAQPQFIQDGLNRNGKGIIDAAEASKIVQLYKDEREIDPTASKRVRQLDGSRIPTTRVPVAVSNQASDRQTLWQQLEAQDRAKAKR